jgi:4-alpha-glucanotransferase
MDTSGSALFRLAEAVGIAARYWDIHGTLHETSPDTMRALLAGMGSAAENEVQAAETLDRLAQAAARRLLPPVWILREGDAVEAPLRLPLGLGARRLRWTLHLEDGGELAGECITANLSVVSREGHGEWQAELRRLPLPALPFGYHELCISGDGIEEKTRLAMAPRRCHMPDKLVRGRGFGVAAQLYALKTANDWGIGDFSALGTLIEKVAAAGGDAVGLNPLHALFLDTPQDASPYCPASRQFRNPLYIDVANIPEFAASDAARALLEADGIESLRKAPLIDYPGVAARKMAALEILFRDLCAGMKGERFAAFHKFAVEGGRELENFASFQALSEHFGSHDWSRWPQGCHDPDSAPTRDLCRQHAGRIAFFEYLQWLCEEQLAAAADRARNMAVGLYNDLAVSVNGDSADCWSQRDLFARDLRVGSPPDPFNEAGQEWGVVPMKPTVLKETGYAHFIALLRANMRHAGALRIDHVMGLRRLFLIPAGGKPAQGAYVRYPLDDLTALIALESRRHNCMTIGEDLGTVPDGFRETLAEADMLSCKVFYFERDGGGFKKPESYPPLAAASVSTHDLATLRGYLDGSDLNVRAHAGMFQTADEENSAREARTREKRELFYALRDAGLLPEGVDPENSAQGWTAALARALQVYLSRAPSKLMLVQLDDLMGVAGQTNLPGSTWQHPNWQRRNPATLEEAFAADEVQGTLRAIAGARS